MHWQTNRNEILSNIKNNWTWLYAFAGAFPCLPTEKQLKEKKLSPERLNFLAAFSIGVILLIKKVSFKFINRFYASR
jgi:hypothetical protein